MLIFNNVSKSIKGKKIIDNVQLKMENGKVYGLVGRNGSGKTMLLRTIAGLLRPDEGTVVYNDMTLYKDVDVFPNIGITIENSGLYPEFTGFKNLKILSSINKKIGDGEIRDAITRVGLNPDDKRQVRKYSLGMKQRIVIAQAIMEKPDILLLDEPTNGLDEKGVEQIREIILAEKERGALVVLASHNKEDIEQLADYVYKVEDGKVN